MYPNLRTWQTIRELEQEIGERQRARLAAAGPLRTRFALPSLRRLLTRRQARRANGLSIGVERTSRSPG